MTDKEKKVFNSSIDEEELKAMVSEGEKLPPLRKHMKTKDGNQDSKVCSGCGKAFPLCNNEVYREYCKQAVIDYHYKTPLG